MEDQISRRHFLKNTALLGIGSVPLSMDGDPLSILGSTDSDARGKSLVVLHLSGGNDGFNTAVPYRSSLYYERRPTLAVASQKLLPLNASIALPEEMSELFKLYSQGKLAVLPAVGYTKMSKSHFRSSDILHTAVPDRVHEKGWLAADGSHRAVSVGDEAAPRIFDGMKVRHVAAHDSVSMANKLHLILEQMEETEGNLFYLSMSGFDTHSQQVLHHPQLLEELSGALGRFQQQLERKKLSEKTIVLVYSEFGRCLFENEEMGTDHGAASTMFVLGTKIRGGVYGEGSKILPDGSSAHDVDFRCVYATILERWLSRQSTSVLNGRYDLLSFLP